MRRATTREYPSPTPRLNKHQLNGRKSKGKPLITKRFEGEQSLGWTKQFWYYILPMSRRRSKISLTKPPGK